MHRRKEEREIFEELRRVIHYQDFKGLPYGTIFGK